MRKYLTTTALVLVCGLAAAALAPLRAETVFRTDEVAPSVIDPARATKSADAVLMYNLYDTLLLPGPGGKGYAPQLAASYTVDPAGTVFTFKLRSDVKFHSGNALTADDVVYSLDRIQAIAAGYSTLFRGWIKSAEAVDPQTVRITLTNTYAPFLGALFRLGIVDKKLLTGNLKPGAFGANGDYGQDYLTQHDAGTGAYRVVSNNPQTETVMEKNPDYFLGPAPKAPDRAIMSFGLQGPTELALMKRGQLDVISQWASPETKRAATQIKGVSIVGESGMAQFVLKLNTKRAPLDDVHCRRALGLALDYDAMISLANITPTIKGAKPSHGPLLEGMLGFDPSIPSPKRDLDKAKAELAQCKYKPDANDMEISWIAEVPLEERFALLMQSNWNDIGFKTHIVRYPFVSYTQLTTKPETTPHVSQLFYNARTPDPDSLLYNAYSSHAVGSYTSVEWLENPQVDALLDKGRSTLDAGERAKIYTQLSHLLVDLAPSIFPYEIINTYPKDASVHIPGLEDPAKNARIVGLNFAFRTFEMTPASP